MSDIDKAIRIEQIETQLKQLSTELWELVQPTADEITLMREEYRDWDADELIDNLVTDDNDAWIIALNTALGAVEMREDEIEMEKAREEQS